MATRADLRRTCTACATRWPYKLCASRLTDCRMAEPDPFAGTPALLAARQAHNVQAQAALAATLADVPPTLKVPIALNAAFEAMDDAAATSAPACSQLLASLRDRYEAVYVTPCNALDIVANVEQLTAQLRAALVAADAPPLADLTAAAPNWCVMLAYCCEALSHWPAATPRSVVAAKAALALMYGVYTAPAVEPNQRSDEVQWADAPDPETIQFARLLCADLAAWQ